MKGPEMGLRRRPTGASSDDGPPFAGRRGLHMRAECDLSLGREGVLCCVSLLDMHNFSKKLMTSSAGCMLLLLVLSASATAASAKGVEELAWDYRFVPTAHHDSPLLGPLQRALVGMHNHLSSAGKDHKLCEDECGMVQRLYFFWWDMEPETCGPLDQNKSLYAGKYCRLQRTLQPLYDTFLRVDLERGGYAFWHDYMGNFWRGMDTEACVRLADVNEPCKADSSRFTAYEQNWLDIARPLIANELRKLSGGQELASEAMAGAASLDRLLLLLARVTCLAQNAREGADAPSTSSSQKGSEGGNVLVVGAGPVGLMTALQARLSGMRVTVWERRSLQERTRDNVVDASESDRNDPQHPAALTLFENIGLLYLGMSGKWMRPRFLRGTALRASQYGEQKDADTEWDLLHSIKHLEWALQKICLLVGVHLQQVELRYAAARSMRLGVGVGASSRVDAQRIPVSPSAACCSKYPSLLAPHVAYASVYAGCSMRLGAPRVVFVAAASGPAHVSLDQEHSESVPLSRACWHAVKSVLTCCQEHAGML